ncbi:MAG: hypothetical protein AB7H80_18555, partial [Candidatus Kapaibacterium sp.]
DSLTVNDYANITNNIFTTDSTVFNTNLVFNDTVLFNEYTNINGVEFNTDSTVNFWNQVEINVDSTVVNNTFVSNDTTVLNGPTIFGDTVIFTTPPSFPLSEDALYVGDASGTAAEFPTTNVSGAILQQDASGRPIWDNNLNVNSVEVDSLTVNDYANITNNIFTTDSTVFNTNLVFNDTVLFNEYTNINGVEFNTDSTVNFWNQVEINVDSTVVNNTFVSNDTTVLNGPTFFGDTVIFTTLPNLPLSQNALYVGNGSNVAVELPGGNSGDVLRINGTAPTWSNPNTLFWGLTGNSGSNSGVNFLGTTDAQDLVFRTNNVVRARFSQSTGGHFLPGTDDTYDLGSPSLRWRDLYLGPTSLHILSNFAETNGARHYQFGIQETPGFAQGNLRLLESGNELLSITQGGNVGIGMSTPLTALTIARPTEVEIRLQSNGASVGAFDLKSRAYIIKRYSGTGGINDDTLYIRNANLNGGSWWQPLVLETNKFALKVASDGGGAALFDAITAEGTSGGIAFRTSRSVGAGVYENHEAMRIVFRNVGIGISGPVHKLHVLFSDTLSGSTAFRKAAINGTATIAEPTSLGIQAVGNNTNTAANTNVALSAISGEVTIGRQATAGANNSGANLMVLGEDDALSTINGPSGVVEVSVNAPGEVDGTTTGTLLVNNLYAKSNSIVLLTILDGGTATFDPAEIVSARISARANGNFTIEVRRHQGATGGLTGTTGVVRVGFLIINPTK